MRRKVCWPARVDSLDPRAAGLSESLGIVRQARAARGRPADPVAALLAVGQLLRRSLDSGGVHASVWLLDRVGPFCYYVVEGKSPQSRIGQDADLCMRCNPACERGGITTPAAMTNRVKLGDQVLVAFPSINKNDTIEENRRQIRATFRVSRCLVKRVLRVSPEHFDLITSRYLEDEPSLWQKVGGSELLPGDDQALRALAQKLGVTGELDHRAICSNPVLLAFYRARCLVNVTALEAPNRPLQFVNTEGHSYARYVGELLEDWQAENQVQEVI
ncbi:MAG: hypothetical protein AAFX65_07395 [Cyanobacteria bacterium J06638_7]